MDITLCKDCGKAVTGEDPWRDGDDILCQLCWAKRASSLGELCADTLGITCTPMEPPVRYPCCRCGQSFQSVEVDDDDGLMYCSTCNRKRQTCRTCRFSRPTDADCTTPITCRRLPPPHYQEYGSWPVIDPDDWCGEWGSNA